MTIELEAKGISEVAAYGKDGKLSITLDEVDMYFLENIPSDVIVKNHNNGKLLAQIDSDEIMTYLEENYSVEIKDIR